MIRKISILLSISVFVAAMSLWAAEEKKLGKKITLKKTTSISEIVANPQKFEGKKVLVQGIAVAVCEHKGCWIDLAGKKDFEKIRVKVNDGEIVFPLTAKGKTVMVEGVVEKIPPSPVMEKEQHEMHQDKKGDQAEGCAMEKTMKEKKMAYWIKGVGAIIK